MPNGMLRHSKKNIENKVKELEEINIKFSELYEKMERENEKEKGDSEEQKFGVDKK